MRTGPFKPPNCCTCCDGLVYCTLTQLAIDLKSTSQYDLLEDVLIPAGFVTVDANRTIHVTKETVDAGIAQAYYGKTYWNKNVIYALAEEFL